jgi:hypothetical protein
MASIARWPCIDPKVAMQAETAFKRSRKNHNAWCIKEGMGKA